MNYLWVLLTILASVMQVTRTALQKSLLPVFDVETITWARFGFMLPFSFSYFFLVLKISNADFPSLNFIFFLWCFWAAVMQILGTMLLVSLLSHRNFTVSTTWVNTEALQIAILGFLFFGESVSWLGGFAILLGLLGVFMMEIFKNKEKKIDWLVALQGSASALCLGITAFSIKGAVATLEVNFLVSTAITLNIITIIQLVLLTTRLWFKKGRNHFLTIWQYRKKIILVSITAMLGSIGWYSAYVIQNPAYVRTLAQIEIPLAIFFSYYFFKEKIKKAEFLGIFIIVVSVIIVILIA